MAVRHGYGKVAGADALVFAYDTGDTRNSYKGEPTTNLVTDTPSGNGWAGAFTVVDSATKTYTIESKQNNAATTSAWRTHYWNVSAYSGSSVTISADVEFVSETDCTFRDLHIGQGNTGSYPYHIAGSDTADKVKLDTKPTTKVHMTWSGVINSTGIVGFTQWINNVTANGANSVLQISNVQIEAKAHETPFINGTRSATQGLLDLTGNNTLNVTNASFDSSAQVTFDGTSDYITIPHNTVMRNTTSLTVETVFQVYSQFGYYGGIIGKGSSDSDEEYFLGIHPSINKIYFDVGQGSGPYVNATQTVNSNQYYHVVAMHERSGGTSTCSIYVNGEFVSNTTSGNTNSVNTNTTDITIGARWSNGSYSLNGDIPLVKMYNRALTAAEIKNNYNNYKSRFNL